MDLLRFATAGSVDDGKSTLIGRLLYDSKAIVEDQLESVERTSRQRGDAHTDLALVLVDARKGVLEQSRRHAFLASLLGIPRLVVCVSKMALVDWSQERYDEI